MAYAFPSAGWVDALVAILNSDTRYAQVARGWEGDIVFAVGPDGPAAEGDASDRIYLDLWHGECRKGSFHPAGGEAAPEAVFTLSATRANLLRILSGDLDPMQAMLTRKLQVRGNMGYMLRNVPVVLDFVRCCRRVEIAP
ncbi:MAG TPA: SCP2 sterol-binding domain-containing protein [Anaerolineales bacterium]|nr:SCP2 sterol-binding domain-containing protein [Anaerolineales bacterium]